MPWSILCILIKKNKFMLARKEYFIVYNKYLPEGKIEEKRVIHSGWSADDAWTAVTNEEKEFNGLKLLEIKRI